MTDPQLFSIIGSVIGVGITLAALIAGLIAWVRSDVRRLDTDFRTGQTRLETRLLAIEKEQARTSGLLEGLGLTGRATPDSQPQPAAGA